MYCNIMLVCLHLFDVKCCYIVCTGSQAVIMYYLIIVFFYAFLK